MVNFEARRSKFSLIIPTVFYWHSSSASQGTERFEALEKTDMTKSENSRVLMYIYFSFPIFLCPHFLKRRNMNLAIVSNINLVALVVTHLAGTIQQSFQHAALPNRADPYRATCFVRKVLI